MTEGSSQNSNEQGSENDINVSLFRMSIAKCSLEIYVLGQRKCGSNLPSLPEVFQSIIAFTNVNKHTLHE